MAISYRIWSATSLNFAVVLSISLFGIASSSHIQELPFCDFENQSVDGSASGIGTDLQNSRCIPLRGGNLTLLHHRCLDYLPNDKCYIYDYGLDFDRTITLLSILDSTVGPSTTTPACLEVVHAYTCNYIYPKCDPATGNYQGVCTDDCIKYVLGDNCRTIFNVLATLAETSGEITFMRQCDNTLINLERYMPGFTYNPEDCFNISGILENVTFSQTNEPPTIPETTNAASDIAIILPSMGATITVLLILATAILLICIYNRRKKRNAMQHSLFQLSFSYKSFLQPGDEETTVKASTLNEMDGKQYETMFADILITYELLEFGESVGEGAFGIVYRGTLMQSADPETKKDVAIKTIKNLVSEDEVKSFFAESLIMKDFSHTHILGLLGMCLDSPDFSPCIVLPFMANGNMKDYLKSKRVNIMDVDTYPEGVELQVLVQMCIDIAEGMEYLAEQRFVHRDLAARNCMVADDLSIKVGDFGLARDVYSANYYRVQRSTKLPVKWMPPETLYDGISNEKTDVWSFGVTCWEAFSLGRTPYPGIENHEILDHIIRGGRLQKPTLCKDKMYELITSCWHINPEHRPPFSDLVVRLRDYWDDEHFYIVQDFQAS